ncbi:malectin-A-like isoform X2 [Porites lutea]|uniref:malectin-A-like isoform X2 n=1 Tax=Porites lutea TaxID=51062 RepID=UPI003CC5D922
MDSLFLELFISLLLAILIGEISSTGEVVYAVNSGGPAHTDLNGVHYQADKLTVGTSSDFGKSLSIGRVAPADQILYQTERYHFSNFGYNIPIKENGDYVLILKFCEVYFQAPRLKVFDVAVNQHTVIKGLDIYERVGRGVGHDEYIPFRVNNNQLLIDGETVPFGGSVYVEFLKMFRSCHPCHAQGKTMRMRMMKRNQRKINQRNSASYLAPKPSIHMLMMNLAC